MLPKSKAYHEESAIKALEGVKRPVPNSWVKMSFKQYFRFSFKPLCPRTVADLSLSDALRCRKSIRDFSTRPVSFEQISTLLYFSAGIKRRVRSRTSKVASQVPLRFYPSAGARYPIETYVIVLRSDKLRRGVYHYNVKRNGLELVFPVVPRKDIKGIFVDNWVSSAPIIVVLGAVFQRTQVKYGERGYRYTLIEAGHICQNMLLVAASIGLGACPLGGFLDDKLNLLIGNSEEYLKSSDATERIVYSVAIGHPAGH